MWWLARCRFAREEPGERATQYRPASGDGCPAQHRTSIH